ncbi:MAG: methylated-DNA--[protein]-cysteine S-methyltransferase [Bacteroidota bacterium]|nr:methylated-DNA--[protein]-cysteine S-methyltransferase [Bacteroidota bacterium]
MIRKRTGKTKANGVSTYHSIWQTVLLIPKGKVATYGQIAELSRLPRQPRLAGYALHNIPNGMEIPWHRVINARGKISLQNESGKRQRKLLEKEGVKFSNDRIELEQFGWQRSPAKRKKSRQM